MAKQHTQSEGTRPTDKQNKHDTSKLESRQEQVKKTAGRENARQVQEPGGEESKHGRKQKGNVDDT